MILTLSALTAFADNYIWMVDDGRSAVVVDPGDADPVLTVLSQRRLRLVGILVTHHHRDHVGGLQPLRAVLDGRVWGPAGENIPGPFIACAHGDQIDLPGGPWNVIDVPGHTAGHIAFFSGDVDGTPTLFCGDTLFSAGCGRVFEGTPAQMHASLSRLAALPAATRVCCAHEYTVSNLRFAARVEPRNEPLQQHLAWCVTQRERGLPTLPSTIGIERTINPFLRCDEPDVRAAAALLGTIDSASDVFARLREWKNQS
jgi:hydroxyacylglutathione hydrolase